MFPPAISNSSTSLSEEASVSSSTRLLQDFTTLNPLVSTTQQLPQTTKKKRNLPGNPDPDAEVIALSPRTLLATNRFVCEICNKGFQRDQNLQLHRRGHNLPWKLKQRNSKEIKKKAYVCPEPTCVHHHPSRALGDLTGIKKHFCRKHGEKKWKCEKCSKIYAVQSDWKAHSKTCGTREYRCDCGTLFSRKDSFITHRAFCDALAEESARLSAHQFVASATNINNNPQNFHIHSQTPQSLFYYSSQPPQQQFRNSPTQMSLSTWGDPQSDPIQIKPDSHHQLTGGLLTSPYQTLHVSMQSASSAHLSATALLQKAATMGGISNTEEGDRAQPAGHVTSNVTGRCSGELINSVVSQSMGNQYLGDLAATWQRSEGLTRDFLGLTKAVDCGVGVGDVGDHLLPYAGGVEFTAYDRDHSLLKQRHHHHCFGFAEQPASETWGDC
ncbi:Zinc finger C2H2-type [Dillenia turbinata]|uniref:Zinc finger C2H2-type n=1 Tax=Dillenia turbinata TaxID=194707 RepID=A0AAN8VXF7_9MAGN